MKSILSWFLLGLFVCGCSTVQVARLDTTRSRTKAVDFYKSAGELKDKQYKEIGYVAYDKPVSKFNYTEALGALLNKARQIGADALILETPPESVTNDVVFRGTAIVYEP